MAQLHRHGAGMSGGAADGHLVAHRAGNGGHHADRQVVLQQHRALLDVDFEIAEQVLPPPRQRWNRFGSRPASHMTSIMRLPSPSRRSSTPVSKLPAIALLPM